MKKTLALLLALLMITSCMVFTTAAETTPAIADDELKIIPVSDGTSGWGGKVTMTEDGAVTAVINGMPAVQTAGGIVEIFYKASTPLDISEMTMLEFDLYLENAVGVMHGGYQVEIRSVHEKTDDCELSLDGGVAYMERFVDYELVDGWNHIEIPLSRFNRKSGSNPYDATQWNWFRIYNQTATNASGEYTDRTNMLGTEGKQTVMKIDNMFFSNKTEAEDKGNGELIITKQNKTYATQPGIASSAGNILQWAYTVPETDITDYTTLNLDVWVSDVDAAKLGYNLELTSAGKSDNEESNMGATLNGWAAMAGTTISKGWNRISIPLSCRNKGGLIPEQFDFFRIFNNALSGTEFATRATDPETGDPLVDEEGNPVYADYGDPRYIIFANAFMSGSRTKEDSFLIMTGGYALYDGAGAKSGVMADRVNADGEMCTHKVDGVETPIEGVETDGLSEWLWLDTVNTANYTLNAGVAITSFTLGYSKPYFEDFGGVQFEIWMSDAKFADQRLNFEFTSAGTCDKEELEMGSTFNTITGQTMEAGKWYTVTLTTKYFADKPVFIPVEFDYMRVHTGSAETYENGVCVAVRNIRAIHDVTPKEKDADGNPVINMDTNRKTGNVIRVRSADDFAHNIAGNMLNVAAGGTIAKSGAQNVNDFALTTPIDVSNADWIRLDLYLENLEEWGAQVNFLFGISSYGSCDHQQMTRSGATIYRMFGDYVVNEDGTKGELKDGWNRIEFPIYELFNSMSNRNEKTADGTAIDWNKSGPIQFDQVDYYRTYVQGTINNAADLTVTKKSVAAIDNITFFDGGDIGTRDDIVTFGSATHDTHLTVLSTNESTVLNAKAYRRVINNYQPMDITDKAYLEMDIYINEVAKNYTTGELENNKGPAAASFQFEISSYSLKADTDEKQFTVNWQNLIKNVEPNTWTTVRIKLPTDFPNTVNKKAITRVEFFNDVSIPANFLWRVDNVRFTCGENGLETKLVSAAPTLTNSIDLTVKGNLNMAEMRTAAYTLSLGGDAGVTQVTAPAALTINADGKSASAALTFTDIPAHRMTDTLTMTMWTLSSDNELTKYSKTYSVQEYAVNTIKKNATNTKLVTLLSDMLAYGAAAQVYANYNMDELANAVEGYAPTTTEFVAPAKLATVLSGNPVDDDFDATFKSATLVLDGTVKIRYTFTANKVEGLTLNVGDKTYTEFATDAQGRYYVDVPVFATQFDETFNAYFGTNTAYSVNYSVNHYIATKYNSNLTKTAALLKALYNYGVSAEAYK